MKKILCIIAIALVVVVIAGCSGRRAQGTTTPSALEDNPDKGTLESVDVGEAATPLEDTTTLSVFDIPDIGSNPDSGIISDVDIDTASI